MSNDWKKIRPNIVYKITKSSNPKFVNKEFTIEPLYDKNCFYSHNIWIKIIIYCGDNIYENPETKLEDNFRCSYKEDGFDKFWKDNQIEYEISKEYGKKLFNEYKLKMLEIKANYELEE